MFNEYLYAEKTFILVPLMHAEDVNCGRLCKAEYEKLVKECEASGNPMAAGFKRNVAFAASHLVPIERFGRYPTRNEALGRETTPEEEEFLKSADRWG